MKRRILSVVLVVLMLAFMVGVSPAGAVSGDGSVTYHLSCGTAGTIDAVVQAVSADNTFHVTSVTSGNGTVAAGSNMIIKSLTLSDGTSVFSDHGFTKNGQSTVTCTFNSPRTGATGETATFSVSSS